MKLSKAVIARKVLRSHGIAGTVAALVRRLRPVQARTFPDCQALVAGKQGLEIGGPSPAFARGGIVPIYPVVGGLDNCNFGAHTTWEGAIQEGLTFQYAPDRPAGRQYIAEATDLKMISSGRYDFVLSSHSIEHTANPLGALQEWMRVLTADGALVLIVPHKEGTFDHRRPTTTLPHLIKDFEGRIAEDDLTHLAESLELHDIDRDWGSPDRDAFKERSLKNFENRCLHHHVFDTSMVLTLLDYVGLQILSVEVLRPFNIVVTARKLPANVRPQNEPFRSATAAWRARSPFRIDREIATPG